MDPQNPKHRALTPPQKKCGRQQQLVMTKVGILVVVVAQSMGLFTRVGVLSNGFKGHGKEPNL